NTRTQPTENCPIRMSHPSATTLPLSAVLASRRPAVESPQQDQIVRPWRLRAQLDARARRKIGAECVSGHGAVPRPREAAAGRNPRVQVLARSQEAASRVPTDAARGTPAAANLSAKWEGDQGGRLSPT